MCELSVLDLSIRPENRLPDLNFSNDKSLGTFIYLFIFIIIIFFTLQYCIGFAIHQHASITVSDNISKRYWVALFFLKTYCVLCWQAVKY